MIAALHVPTPILRRLVAGAAALLAAVALSACGGGAEASDVTVVEVELGHYTITPNVITVPAGEVELRVTNVDTGMIHNLAVAGKGTRPLAPGETQVLPMGEVALGDYTMWCDVQGHAQMGQSGTFRVVPPAAAGTDTANAEAGNDD